MVNTVGKKWCSDKRRPLSNRKQIGKKEEAMYSHLHIRTWFIELVILNP
jgi:hypothetical protein